jgi:hypothetical protein
MPWQWEEDTQRYREVGTGLFLSASDIRDLSSERIRIAGSGTDGLARMVAGDQLNNRDWEVLMRQAIKREYVQQYELGRGGVTQMTPQDWGSIGGMLADQYRFLGDFSREIENTELSEAQIAQRSQMYIRSSREAASRANQRAQGWPELPAHPGDGSTICLTNCACHWDGDGTDFTWILDFDAEHCTSDELDAEGRPRGCIERAKLWNPLVIEA